MITLAVVEPFGFNWLSLSIISVGRRNATEFCFFVSILSEFTTQNKFNQGLLHNYYKISCFFIQNTTYRQQKDVYFVYNMLYTYVMKAIRVKTVINKLDNNKFCFSPASEREKLILNKFCEEAGKRYVTLSAELVGSKKSYDQVKTVFALIDAIFTSQEARHPTEAERHALYMYFLRQYAPRIQVSGQPGITEPKSLSIMTKEEAARFITDLATYLATQCNLPDYLITDVTALFEEHIKQTNLLYPDLIDKDCNGKEYSIDDWCKVNSFSHASGSTETLEIAHIISKGSAPQFRDCVWNFLRLTHEEHMFQHQKGWSEFLSLFPHLRPRVERARRLASEKGGF